MSQEERAVFDNYKKVLDGGDELTAKQIKEFCQQQIQLIEAKWRKFDTREFDKGLLIPYHTVYKVIIQAIEAPAVERENLEKYLNQLINQ